MVFGTLHQFMHGPIIDEQCILLSSGVPISISLDGCFITRTFHNVQNKIINYSLTVSLINLLTFVLRKLNLNMYLKLCICIQYMMAVGL